MCFPVKAPGHRFAQFKLFKKNDKQRPIYAAN